MVWKNVAPLNEENQELVLLDYYGNFLNSMEIKIIKFYSILMSTLIREFLCESFAKIVLTPKLGNFCD